MTIKMAGSRMFLSVALLFVFIHEILCDTPANCTYEEIKGKWVFHMGKGGRDRTIDCTKSCV